MLQGSLRWGQATKGKRGKSRTPGNTNEKPRLSKGKPLFFVAFSRCPRFPTVSIGAHNFQWFPSGFGRKHLKHVSKCTVAGGTVGGRTVPMQSTRWLEWASLKNGTAQANVSAWTDDRHPPHPMLRTPHPTRQLHLGGGEWWGGWGRGGRPCPCHGKAIKRQ